MDQRRQINGRYGSPLPGGNEGNDGIGVHHDRHRRHNSNCGEFFRRYGIGTLKMNSADCNDTFCETKMRERTHVLRQKTGGLEISAYVDWDHAIRLHSRGSALGEAFF